MYLINRVQTLTNNWLVTVSFSIGIGDAVADQSTMRNIESIIDEAKDKVKQLVQRGQRASSSASPGRTMIESFEAMVNRVLNAARTSAGLSVQDSISEANNVKSMAMAGSKGNDINISQIIACVGQQNVEGKRIPYGFRRRTLPHFAKDDLGPESRGFVENSYLRGLSPQEFFFHAMGGREGSHRYGLQNGPDRLFAEKTGQVHGVDGGPVRWHGADEPRPRRAIFVWRRRGRRRLGREAEVSLSFAR